MTLTEFSPCYLHSSEEATTDEMGSLGLLAATKLTCPFPSLLPTPRESLLAGYHEVRHHLATRTNCRDRYRSFKNCKKTGQKFNYRESGIKFKSKPNSPNRRIKGQLKSMLPKRHDFIIIWRLHRDQCLN